MSTFDAICKRAGGRRRYNAQRKAAAAKRFAEVRRLWALYSAKHGRYKRGLQARIARELGVSRTTIGRDMVGIRFLEWGLENPVKACRFIWGTDGEVRDIPDKVFLMMFGRDHRPPLRRVRRETSDEDDWNDEDPLW
jgi:hypothetical protein